RARIDRLHLDRREVDLGQRGQRQEMKADDAAEHDRGHEQGRGDRPQDERPRRAHYRFPWPAPGPPWPPWPPLRRYWRRLLFELSAGGFWAPFCAASGRRTRAPSVSRSPPSVTTRSPAARPVAVDIASSEAGPTVTGRIVATCSESTT